MSKTSADEVNLAVLAHRRAADHILPADDLVAARDSDAWPKVQFSLPIYAEHGAFEATVLTRPDVAREALLAPQAVSGTKGLPGIANSIADQPGFLIHMSGDDHRRVRQVLMRHLTVKRVNTLRPRVEEIVNDLLDEMERKGNTADLVTDFARPMSSAVICELLGVPHEDHEHFAAWTHGISHQDSTPEEAKASVVAMRDFLSRLADHVRANPGAGLLSALVHDHSDTLTNDEVVGLGILVFLGGFDTTTAGMALSTFALLEHPDQLAAVRDGEVPIADALEELLRFTTPNAGSLQRLLTEDLPIGNRMIRKGERFIVSFLAANSDPTLVGDRPELDVRRKRVNHLAFGYGIHACAGQHLARLELQVALPALLNRFPTLRLNGNPEEFDWREVSSSYGVSTLPVAWESNR